jgi:hypothetical protein
MNLLLYITHIRAQTTIIPTISHTMGFIAFTHFSKDFTPIIIPAPCNDLFVITVKAGLTAIIGVLRTLGVAATIHGIVMGGLIRILSFGDQRRISESNKAIIESIIGLIIVLLSITVGNQIPVWFGLTTQACPISPSASSIQG